MFRIESAGGGVLEMALFGNRSNGREGGASGLTM